MKLIKLLLLTALATFAPVTTAAPTPVCDRTQQLRDAIRGNRGCGETTNADLAGITGLDLNNRNITSLASYDFAGLSKLTRLNLNGNRDAPLAIVATSHFIL